MIIVFARKIVLVFTYGSCCAGEPGAVQVEKRADECDRKVNGISLWIPFDQSTKRRGHLFPDRQRGSRIGRSHDDVATGVPRELRARRRPTKHHELPNVCARNLWDSGEGIPAASLSESLVIHNDAVSILAVASLNSLSVSTANLSAGLLLPPGSGCCGNGHSRSLPASVSRGLSIKVL